MNTSGCPTFLKDREAFGHWLSGLVDGEGSFLLARRQGKAYKPYFRVQLRADDQEILEQVAAYLACGKITQHPSGPKKRLQSRYAVYNTEHLVTRIIPHFGRYPLRAKKAKDFEIWKEAVLLIRAIQSRGPWRPTDIEVIKALADKLTITRQFTAPHASLTELGGESPCVALNSDRTSNSSARSPTLFDLLES